MAIRQEQVVLIGTCLLLGYMVFADSDVGRRGGGRAGAAPEFEHHFAPDVTRAMPWERKEGGIGRELFSAPRDTRPLPALRFVAPPLEPLALLRPIPSSGPRPALYGNFLRQKKELRLDTSLFLNDQNVEGSAGTGDQFVVDAELDESLLTPEERQARLASYKANYDSLNLGNLHFGQIYNRNRFSLSERPD